MFKLFLYIILTQITWAITPIPQGYVAPAPQGVVLPPFTGTLQATISNPLNQGSTFGKAVSISRDGLYAIMTAPLWEASISPQYSGAAYVFKRTGITWALEATIKNPTLMEYESFGSSASISGDGMYAVVGCMGYSSSRGIAYVFKRTGTTWALEGTLSNPTAEINANFGFAASISADGTYVLVGAHQEDSGNSNSGAAYVFKRTGVTWALEATIANPTDETGSQFGAAVAITSDYALIGANLEDNPGGDTGAAYVFKRNVTSWGLEATLSNPSNEVSSQFGSAVSISDAGDYSLVGAKVVGANDSGAAYIFKRNVTSWGLEVTLTHPTNLANAGFGTATSLSGDGTTALIGVAINAGTAYVYKRSGTSWPIGPTLTNPTGEINSLFGSSLSISGDGRYVLIGASSEDLTAMNTGIGYIFN